MQVNIKKLTYLAQQDVRGQLLVVHDNQRECVCKTNVREDKSGVPTWRHVVPHHTCKMPRTRRVGPHLQGIACLTGPIGLICLHLERHDCLVTPSLNTSASGYALAPKSQSRETGSVGHTCLLLAVRASIAAHSCHHIWIHAVEEVGQIHSHQILCLDNLQCNAN
jgi:hypothetical protein